MPSTKNSIRPAPNNSDACASAPLTLTCAWRSMAACCLSLSWVIHCRSACTCWIRLRASSCARASAGGTQSWLGGGGGPPRAARCLRYAPCTHVTVTATISTTSHNIRVDQS